jgi:glycosyltransferase involved in cell wall biosynthesis
MINLLTFTTLYPNATRLTHGVFVENRLRHLVASGSATATVVAPVTYVPNLSVLPAKYRRLRDVPRHEQRHGIEVHHPRYLLVPKVSMLPAPFALYLASRAYVAELVAQGVPFDLIDAHYFYPDGIAAVLLGRYFRKPVTITARGSDINVISRYRLPRRMIVHAAERAAAIITVSEALKRSLESLGVAADRIRVLRNGVDLATFDLGDRQDARQQQGLSRTTLLSVGNLIPLKGHDLAIRALATLPDKDLVIVGDGPEEGDLRSMARRLGVADRVTFRGRVAHHALPDIYRAADVLLLLSSSEGWANVLLEAMACGTPVVATLAGGNREVVATPEVGELVRERTAEAVSSAIQALLARRPDRQTVRRYAEGFSWDATTAGQLEVFTSVRDGHRHVPPRQSAAASLKARPVAPSLDFGE